MHTIARQNCVALCVVPHRLHPFSSVVYDSSDGDLHSTLVSNLLIILENLVNKKQVKGHYEEAKGAFKQAAGKLIGNKELELKVRPKRQRVKSRRVLAMLSRASRIK